MTDPQDTPASPPPAEPGPGRAKPWWTKWLRLAVAALILWGLFYLIPAGDVFDALRRTRPLPVLGAIAITALMYLATADRLRRLCDAHGHNWSTLDILGINLATRFYGLFLWGGNVTGIVIRFMKLTGDKKKYLGTAVALFYDRIAATVALCALGAVFWLIERPGGSWQALIAIVACLLVMLAMLMLLFARSPGPVVTRLRRLFSKLGGVKLRTVREAVQESRTLTTRQITTVYTLSVLAHLLGVVGWYLLCNALGIELSFVTVGWIRTAVILATMIPISVSGLGLREGAVVFLLARYGVGQETALAYSLLIFFVTTLLVGLAGGAVELIRALRPAR